MAAAYHVDMSSPLPTSEQVTTALAGVNDPEIGRPITELGMVKSVSVGADGRVDVGVYLTVAGCPMRDTITSRVTGAVTPLGGVTGSAADIAIQAEQFAVIKKEMFRLNAEFTGQPLERIETDSDRDRWFTAPEALEYGFVDHIITRAHVNGEAQ